MRARTRLIDRVMRTLLRAGFGRRSTALLETTGRVSGLPRVTPVTNGADGDVFWVVTEHGLASGYVRNLEADPRVRVMVGGRWRSGVARLLDPGEHDGNPEHIMARIGEINPRARGNLAIVRRAGGPHLVIRIDLD